MRVELLLLFCLACLAFTAQAAPASAQDALLAQKMAKRNDDDRSKKSKHDQDHEHHHHHRHHHHHEGAKDHKDRHRKQDGSSSNHKSSPLKHRAINGEEVEKAEEGLSNLVHPQEDRVAALRAKVYGKQQAHHEKELSYQREVELEDAVHVAKHGSTPPKFPTITRVASAIGLTAAVMNVVNFMFSAKTTALATTQFSAPPSPPTLIDTAARWDGKQYTLMPLPEEPKRKRSLPDSSSTQRLQKRHFGSKVVAEPGHSLGFAKRRASIGVKVASDVGEGADQSKLSKRGWLLPSLVGFGLGGVVAPEFITTVRGKKNEGVEKPPFDPYDPNILKPKDPFSVAAADPNQALPDLPLSQVTSYSAPSTSPNAGGGFRFPSVSSSNAPTPYTQSQLLTNPSSGQSQSVNPGVGYAGIGSGSEASGTSEASPVLRKRTVVVPDTHSEGGHIDDTSSSALDKRFFGGGGTWGKLAMFATAGSVIPLVYGGVTHARERTYNPRDRSIVEQLDDKPTYGAIGVPGRVPGQLATNAMPGYTDYVKQLEQQQAQAQAQALAAALAASQVEQVTEAGASADASIATSDSEGGDPVLRRRDLASNGQTRVEKRGWLMGGSLAALGILVGYAQSATQFPTDRNEEKDKKRREMKKQQQEMAAQQGQMGGAPQGAGELPAGSDYAGVGAAGGGFPVAGANAAGSAPSSSYGYGAGSGSSPSYGYGAGSGSSLSYGSGGGYSSASSYGLGGGTSSYGLGGGSSTSYGTGGLSSGSGGGGASSLGASLNAAAGLQASSGGGGGGGSVLKKRNTASSEHQPQSQSLSKRTPGWGSALSIGGTTMFLGTLAANIWVGTKQKNKPTPYVTPDAYAKGPMPMGGDLYAEFLASKRPPTMGGTAATVGGLPAGASYGVGARTVSAGATNYGTAVSVAGQGGGSSQSPAQSGGDGSGDAGGAGTETAPDESDSSKAGPNDPVLKKRHQHLQKRAVAAELAALERAPAVAEMGAAVVARLRASVAATEAAGGAASVMRPAAGAFASEGAGLSSAARSGAFSRFYPGGAGGAGSAFAREGALASEGGLSAVSRTAPLSAMARGPTMEGLSYSMYRPNAAAWGAARPAMATEMKAATGTAGTPATIEGLAAEGAEGQAVKKPMTASKAMGIIGSGAGVSMMMNGLG